MQNFLLVCLYIIVLIFYSGVSSTAQISDSIFIEVNDDEKLVLKYHVGKRETWYSISRKFSTTPNRIKRNNPNLQFYEKPPEFAILAILIEESNIHYRFPLFTSRDDFQPVYYRVRPKDNFFRITRVYFDIPPSLLRHRNQLEEEILPVGKILHIGWVKVRQMEDLVVYEGRKIMSGSSVSLGSFHERFSAQESKFKVTQENGVAWWNKEEEEKSSGLFVLHRHAASNTVIELTNPMFNTTLYAKVIGKIPENMYAEEIDLIVTSEIAQKLKVVDQKFFCRMRFISSKDIVSH